MNSVDNKPFGTLYDWQKAFVHAIKTKDIIILHGNIRDIYAVDAGKIYGAAANLTDALTAILTRCCPELTPVFPLDGPITDLGPEVQEDWKTAIIHDIQPPLSNEPQASGSREATLPELARRINHLPDGDKIIVSIRSDRMLPAPLYLNNPRVRLIPVPSPGAEQRLAFIHKKMFSEHPVETAAQNHIPWFISEMTAGMTLRDIGVMLDYVPGYLDKELKDSKEQDIESAINAFKFPGYEDYFNTIPMDPPEGSRSLRSLHTAPGFFLGNDIYTNNGNGGPEEAGKAAAAMIEKIRTGVCRMQSQGLHPDRPKGVFLFCGPRGTGKNRTAAKIAEFIYKDTEAVIHFDLASQRQDAAVVGLIKKIREKPFSVIIIHNIDKANPRLLEIAETILRKGRTTDYAGETVYFSQTVVVFVTAIGARTQQYRGNGGRPHTEKQELDNLIEQYNREDAVENKIGRTAIKDHFFSCVERFFREEIHQPQWLNLVGSAIVPFWFASSRAGIMNSLRINLKQLQANFSRNYMEQKLTLGIDIEAAAELFYKKYHTLFRQSGPDSIGLKIRDDILPQLASFMNHLREGENSNRLIKLTVDYNDRLVFE